MSCMYPRKKMKPVESKTKKRLKGIVVIGGCLSLSVGLMMATPTLFNIINPVDARSNVPRNDVMIYKDKTKYGTCEYLVAETDNRNGDGVSITPRMTPAKNQNGSEHYCY